MKLIRNIEVRNAIKKNEKNEFKIFHVPFEN